MALEVFTNKKDGLEARIHEHRERGFSITFHDIDANEQLPQTCFHRDIAMARNIAESFAFGL